MCWVLSARCPNTAHTQHPLYVAHAVLRANNWPISKNVLSQTLYCSKQTNTIHNAPLLYYFLLLCTSMKDTHSQTVHQSSLVYSNKEGCTTAQRATGIPCSGLPTTTDTLTHNAGSGLNNGQRDYKKPNNGKRRGVAKVVPYYSGVLRVKTSRRAGKRKTK